MIISNATVYYYVLRTWTFTCKNTNTLCVQFKLNPLQIYCKMEGVDRLVEVKEETTCNYSIVIHTPLLCQHPMLVPLGSSTPSHTLSCTPVVSQLDYEDYLLKQGQLSKYIYSCTHHCYECYTATLTEQPLCVYMLCFKLVAHTTLDITIRSVCKFLCITIVRDFIKHNFCA